MTASIGTNPDQIPLNGMLGTLAFQDADGFLFSQKMPSIRPSLNLDFVNGGQLDPRITFSRNQVASYYDGKTVAKAEENLFLYSQDFSNPAWTSSEGITLGALTTAPDNTTTATPLVESTSSTSHRVRQSITTSSSPTLSVYAKAGTRSFLFLQDASNTHRAWFDLTAGTVSAVTGGVTASIIASTNGFYRCIVNFNVTSTIYTIEAMDVSGSTAYTGIPGNIAITIWGAQLEQRSSATAYTPTTTSTITNYIPQLMTAGINVPRLDYDPITGKPLGLLIEESRTNLFPNSLSFGNVPSGAGSLNTTAAIAPNGTQTAVAFIEDSTFGDRYSQQNFNGTYTAGVTFVYSIYVKAGSYANHRLLLADSTNSSVHTVIFNILTGALVSSSITGLASIPFTPYSVNVGNGWFRLVMGITLASASTVLYCQQKLNGLVSSPGYQGNGYNYALYWGAQLEAGSFATSYIPTTSGAVTRGADIASMTGTNFSSWYNQGQGSLYLESDTTCFSEFDAGTGTTRLALSAGYPTSSTVSFNAVYPIGTSTTVTASQSNYIYGQSKYKFIGSYFSGSTISTSFNGQGATSQSIGALPIYTRLAIGSNLVAGIYLNGHIKKISYYPIALTSAELQGITTL